ncbi:MAG: hypothetical protein IAF02_12595 [Anaerolineae bacterium]|nr:hypothetical protein [Anaerolineae bacterium]
MLATLEKIKRLEQYLSVNQVTVDPVLDQSIDKILAREQGRLHEMQLRLSAQITEFENQYQMTSENFSQKYQAGMLGDDIDFIEWAATLDMLANIDIQLSLLSPAA